VSRFRLRVATSEKHLSTSKGARMTDRLDVCQALLPTRKPSIPHLRSKVGVAAPCESGMSTVPVRLCGVRGYHRLKRVQMTGCFARSIRRTVLAGHSPSEIGEALLHSTTADAVPEQNEGARRVYL